MLSVVIPAFNEQENIPVTTERMREILSPITEYELIFVDDGSRDNTWKIIKELSEKDSSVKRLWLNLM